MFRKQLTDTLTSIIFTASVQHQAVNGPHHLYSYMPHRPLTLTKYDFGALMATSETPIRDHRIHPQESYLVSRWMPPEEGEEDITWSWIKEALPDIQLTEVFRHLLPALKLILFLRRGPMSLE